MASKTVTRSIIRKVQTSLEMFKTFYSSSDWRMICFYSNIGCSESKVIFKWRKNNNNSKNNKKKPLQGANVRTSCISFSLSQNSHRTRQTNAGDKGCAEACAERFSPLKDQHWRHSLQSITRPFQKRFREVFGNARILIFYLSIKAWEEKSLPKSHLGWFFLVFGEGKATKENISIFWFIWPLARW